MPRQPASSLASIEMIQEAIKHHLLEIEAYEGKFNRKCNPYVYTAKYWRETPIRWYRKYLGILKKYRREIVMELPGGSRIYANIEAEEVRLENIEGELKKTKDFDEFAAKIKELVSRFKQDAALTLRDLSRKEAYLQKAA